MYLGGDALEQSSKAIAFGEPLLGQVIRPDGEVFPADSRDQAEFQTERRGLCFDPTHRCKEQLGDGLQCPASEHIDTSECFDTFSETYNVTWRKLEVD